MTEATVLPHPTGLREGFRINWERLIIDIQRSTWLDGSSQRYSLKAIATACGRGENWAWNLKNIPGTEPRYHDALMLLGLWVEKTGKTNAELPVHREFERARK